MKTFKSLKDLEALKDNIQCSEPIFDGPKLPTTTLDEPPQYQTVVNPFKQRKRKPLNNQPVFKAKPKNKS